MARQKKKLKLPPEDRGWPIMTSWQVRKWIRLKHRAVICALGENLPNQKRNGKPRRIFFFTLKFDRAGNWIIVRTCELPAKAFEGLNKEEREEVGRLKKEE